MKKLNFGCGKDIRKRWINVDIQKHKDIDKSFDFDKFPYPFKNNEFDYIHCDNVLEHLEDPERVLEELHRITKNKGIIYIRVPYCRSILSYNDITHKHHFNQRAMEQITKGHDRYSVNEEKKKFNVIRNELRPTFYGKLFPKIIRKYANYLLNEIYDMIIVELEVEKRNSY